MSVEGMWAFVSASVFDPQNMGDGGIVILETNRVFGGDSAMAYVGTYEVSGQTITAKVKTWQWNPNIEGPSVFGVSAGDENHITLTGTIDGDIIEGWIESGLAPGFTLQAGMKKISELP